MPDSKSKILVHACCAACASYVVMELEKEGMRTTLLYYNPEALQTRFEKSLGAMESLTQMKKVKLITPQHNSSEFHDLVAPFEDPKSIKFINDKERLMRKRRDILISLILQKTISEVKKIRYSDTTTSMLCSPYRDHNTIWDTGVRLADENRMNFFYKDFRKGYWMGRNFCRSNQLYIPEYCSDYLS